jgi:hypothetical protein
MPVCFGRRAARIARCHTSRPRCLKLLISPLCLSLPSARRTLACSAAEAEPGARSKTNSAAISAVRTFRVSISNSRSAFSTRPGGPALGSAHHHINAPAAAPRAYKPRVPIRDARLGGQMAPISAGVGLDLLVAIEAPDYQTHMGRREQSPERFNRVKEQIPWGDV